mmetsp:Transcript_12906/g.47789  ORF Transcript_12906/g.47789 Transcript_12906/m.47789 type:complete len:319 (-) Transcript_12906:268-1224(-)
MLAGAVLRQVQHLLEGRRLGEESAEAPVGAAADGAAADALELARALHLDDADAGADRHDHEGEGTLQRRAGKHLLQRKLLVLPSHGLIRSLRLLRRRRLVGVDLVLDVVQDELEAAHEALHLVVLVELDLQALLRNAGVLVGAAAGAGNVRDVEVERMGRDKVHRSLHPLRLEADEVQDAAQLLRVELEVLFPHARETQLPGLVHDAIELAEHRHVVGTHQVVKTAAPAHLPYRRFRRGRLGPAGVRDGPLHGHGPRGAIQRVQGLPPASAGRTALLGLGRGLGKRLVVHHLTQRAPDVHAEDGADAHLALAHASQPG